jgi:predicted Zn finger-like uncharacterized protein
MGVPNYINTTSDHRLDRERSSPTVHTEEPVPIDGGKCLKKRRFRATANERILIHLLDYVREKDEVEHPKEITQAGIARILGTVRSHISLALSSLRDRGYVTERLGRVENEMRRRKVYFLSQKGYTHAKELKHRFLRREIRVPTEEGAEDVRIGALDDFLGEEYFLVDVLSCVSSGGELNLLALTGSLPEIEEEEEPDEPQIPPAHIEVQAVEYPIIETYDGLELAVPQMQICCPNCRSYFFIQTLTPLEYVKTRCPNCLQLFMPIAHPSPQPTLAKPRKFSPESFSAGVGLVSLMIFAPLVVFLPVACLLYFLGIPATILLFYHTFSRIEKPTERERKIVLIGLSIIAFCATMLVHAILIRTHPAEFFSEALMIVVPFLVLLVASIRMPLNLARETLAILSISYLLLGFLISSMPEGLAWAAYLYPYFIVLGAAAFLYAYIAARFKHFTPRGVCMGIGMPITISAASWVAHYHNPFFIEGIIPAILWLFLGMVLVAIRFLPADESERIIETLKVTGPYALGAFFIALGILLLVAFRFFESVIPLVVGIPIAYLGIETPVRSPRRGRIVFLGFATILMLATLYPIFLI